MANALLESLPTGLDSRLLRIYGVNRVVFNADVCQPQDVPINAFDNQTFSYGWDPTQGYTGGFMYYDKNGALGGSWVYVADAIATYNTTSRVFDYDHVFSQDEVLNIP